jgi:cephalosporin-C deacetylase-like acetyl esterase
MEFTIVYRRLVAPATKASGEIMPLSPCDRTAFAIATSRASFWPGTRFNVAALEEAVRQTVTDMPFLAGR